jgi:hypothetical protein
MDDISDQPSFSDDGFVSRQASNEYHDSTFATEGQLLAVNDLCIAVHEPGQLGELSREDEADEEVGRIASKGQCSSVGGLTDSSGRQPTERFLVQKVEPSCQHFRSKPQAWRDELIRKPWIFPIAAMHLAAARIQRTWRPCWLRTTFAKQAPSVSAGGGLEAIGTSVVPIKRRKAMRDMTHEEKEARSVVVREVLQERYLNLLKRQYGYSNMKPDAEVAELVCYPSYEHFTAAFIQSFFRHRKEGHAKAFARMREFKRYSLYHVAAFEIQSAWRVTCQRWELKLLTGELMRKHGINHVSTSRIWAASKIQNAWRKNSNYRIYSALLDLVARFRGMGDPHLLLKAVLPRESMLLDPSMQVHVRFRLGGERFPPSIYYKIFTHGAVCDLGAFAPRNYAAERLGAPRREEDFYCRSENNGWRPLVVRYQVGARGPRRDPIEKATAQKIVKNFHHSRLHRRQDVERKRKEKTRLWMQKLYALRGEADDNDEPECVAAGAPSAIGGAVRLARGTSQQAETKRISPKIPQLPAGPPSGRPQPSSRTQHLRTRSRSEMSGRSSPFDDISRDDDVKNHCLQEEVDMSDDMLLEWSKRLDFNAYMDNWAAIATSDCSEGNLPIGIVPRELRGETVGYRGVPHTMIARVH